MINSAWSSGQYPKSAWPYDPRISYSFGDTEAKMDWGRPILPPLAGLKVNTTFYGKSALEISQ